MTRPGRSLVMGGAMLALFVLAIVVFILPFAFPTPPPIVTRFQSTVLFSPNGDGARDVARISVRLREMAEVTLEVQRDGQTVRRLLDDEPSPPGWVRVTWDGRDDDGQLVEDGSYALKLRARAGRKRFNTTRRVTVDTAPPPAAAISARSVPAPGRGQCLVSVEPLDDAQVLIEARARPGADPVRTLGPRPARPDGALRWNWDGNDAEGVAVAPGLYRIRVTTSDAARNRTAMELSCWVGQLAGRSAPARVRPGARVRAILRRPGEGPLARGAGVQLSLHERAATPGADLSDPVGPRVAGPVIGRAGRAAVTVPGNTAPTRLWLVAQSGGGVALIPLRP